MYSMLHMLNRVNKIYAMFRCLMYLVGGSEKMWMVLLVPPFSVYLLLLMMNKEDINHKTLRLSCFITFLFMVKLGIAYTKMPPS